MSKHYTPQRIAAIVLLSPLAALALLVLSPLLVLCGIWELLVYLIDTATGERYSGPI